jgi:Lar family restriction alleviation protein
MPREKLKPCPFCGSRLALLRPRYGAELPVDGKHTDAIGYFIHCQECNATVDVECMADDGGLASAECAAKWNQRATPEDNAAAKAVAKKKRKASKEKAQKAGRAAGAEAKRERFRVVE